MLSAEGGYYPSRDRLQVMCKALPQFDRNNFRVCFNAFLDLNDEQDVREITETIRDYRPKVLIYDPFVQFHQQDENAASEMARVLGLMRRINEDFHVASIVVHHTGKNEENGARGSSAIAGAYDSAIFVKRREKDHVLSFDMRHVETPPDLHLRFDADTLWFQRFLEDGVAKVLYTVGQSMTKKELADACVKAGLYTAITNAYKGIDRVADGGEIEEREGRYHVRFSPLSSSPGE